MSGNIFGELFKVVTFGESHGPGMGCVIDGCPAGLELSVEDIALELRRRRPAQGGASTSRSEADEPEILSGVFEGKTLGSPIAILVRNTGGHSADYDNLRDLCRPGHADFAWGAKYGIRDHRGGGRSSGRETLCRVAAGAVAKKILANHKLRRTAWTSSIAGLDMPQPGDEDFNLDEVEKNPLRAPGKAAAERALKAIEALRAEGDSCGGIVSCVVSGVQPAGVQPAGVPPGLGEPVFGKLDARLAAAMLSIGAVKGIEFGAGFSAANLKGSENNDIPVSAAPAVFKTNNAGGILGGISSGQDIIFKVAFKPTPSISKPQKAINSVSGNIEDLVINGRHDACVVPRAVPVVEAMAALTLADLVLLRRTCK
jgi:chorismate synthase